MSEAAFSSASAAISPSSPIAISSEKQKTLIQIPRGKLIVFEGGDASGKATQSGHLFIKMRNEGKKVELLAFPTYYKTKYGRLVAEYLKGEYGDKDATPVEISSMFYAIDRYQLREEMREKLENGIFLVLDRYWQANAIYQGSKFLDEKTRTAIFEWIKIVESRLVQPDVVVFLNVPEEVSQTLFKERQAKNALLKDGEADIHEKDRQYQERVREFYREKAMVEKWIIVDCCKKDGENFVFRTPEDIHQEVWDKLKERGVV